MSYGTGDIFGYVNSEKTAIVCMLTVEERAHLGGKDLNMKTYQDLPPRGLLYSLIQKYLGLCP